MELLDYYLKNIFGNIVKIDLRMGSIISKPKKQKKYLIYMDRVIISNNKNIYLMDKDGFKAKIITEKLIYDEVML